MPANVKSRIPMKRYYSILQEFEPECTRELMVPMHQRIFAPGQLNDWPHEFFFILLLHGNAQFSVSFAGISIACLIRNSTKKTIFITL